MAPALGPRDDASLGEQVYQAVRWALIVGDLEPGDTVSTRPLAARHGVSAMPVREALKRLEAEKALTGSAKRAYQVAVLTPAQAANLFLVQSVLEGAAAEAAAPRLPDRSIARLRELTLEMDAAMAAEDARRYLACNFSFHHVIYAGSGNPELAAIVEALYTRTGPWLSRAIRRFAGVEDWQNHHGRIADAIAARDATQARQLMEADIRWNVDLYSRVLPEAGSGAGSAGARRGEAGQGEARR